MYRFLFIFFIFVNAAKSQSFGNQFLPLIIEVHQTVKKGIDMDDSIFYTKNNILILDTAFFFSQDHFNIGSKKCTVVRSFDNFSHSSIFSDTIVINSVRAFNDNFIINMRHNCSLYDIDYHFLLLLGKPPELTYICYF